jgi:pimeloyl-ACP methyl ester carboxylesterase
MNGFGFCLILMQQAIGCKARKLAIAILVLSLNFSINVVNAQSTTSPLTLVDFENVSGPSIFSHADPSLTLNTATFTGGQILTNATYLPVDPTSVYGTSYFCVGCLDTITIDFAQKVSNFSLLLMNGLYYTVTYTVEDDQGGTQQVSLVANADAGATTVSLPESGIRQVVISADPSTWDFEIDNVQFSATTLALLDPVASQFLTQYAQSASITTDTDVLASGGTLVLGASADGVTQLLVRLPAAKAGDVFNLSLQDEDGNATSTGAIGGLFNLGKSPANAALTLSVTAVDTASGPMAFAAFVAPMDFSRSDSDATLATRPVTLQVAGATQTTGTINIVRPPVIMIHGLWGEGTDWSGFTPLTDPNQTTFYTSFADYSGYVSGITATSPTYSSVKLTNIRSNSLGFAYNAAQVEKYIRNTIEDFKANKNVAAVQADLVGHSMGGNVSRYLAQLADFVRGDNYGQGMVNKLITIGTPHLGSPLATDLLNGQNNCSAKILAGAGMPSFTSLTVNNATVSGAVADLQGVGDGTGLSGPLTSEKQTTLPFPLANIAAKSTSANWVNVGKSLFSKSGFLHKWCSSDPIAVALTPTDWPSLFGNGDSDSVVPFTSQINGRTTGAGGPYSGIIHSAGLESLDFSAPAELDAAGSLATEVVKLLNEAKSGQDFYIYGGVQ